VDRERAELHLRRLAEDTLRRAAEGQGKPPYGLTSLSMAAREPDGTRVAQVTQALVAVGAVSAGTAEAITADLELALAVRRPGSQSRFEVLSSAAIRRRLAGLMRPAIGPAGRIPPGPAPARTVAAVAAPDHRIAPVGMMIPVSVDGCRGELYLLAYLQTASHARFAMIGWLRDQEQPGQRPTERAIRQLTVTDGKGTQYRIGYTGTSGGTECAGDLRLEPGPAADVDWLDVSAGDCIRRVPLTPPAPAARLTPVTRTAGEQHLHSVAARILAVALFPNDRTATSSHRFKPTLPAYLAAGLGDIIAGLQAAAVLSPLSPVPGQLATLCDSLGLTGHGITAPPARELPGTWLSMLSQYLRRKPQPVPTAAAGAGAAVTFPPVDGITLSVVGLHNGEDGTVLHIDADVPAELLVQAGLGLNDAHDILPPLWLRDDGGRWHTMRRAISLTSRPGGLAALLQVVPPLPRTATVEIVVSGTTAEASVVLPLRWR
jgi:hypothetical protein